MSVNNIIHIIQVRVPNYVVHVWSMYVRRGYVKNGYVKKQ